MLLSRMGQLVVSAVLGSRALGGIVDEPVESLVEVSQSLRRRQPLTQVVMNRTPCPFPLSRQFNRPFFPWEFTRPRCKSLPACLAARHWNGFMQRCRFSWNGLGYEQRFVLGSWPTQAVKDSVN